MFPFFPKKRLACDPTLGMASKYLVEEIGVWGPEKKNISWEVGPERGSKHVLTHQVFGRIFSMSHHWPMSFSFTRLRFTLRRQTTTRGTIWHLPETSHLPRKDVEMPPVANETDVWRYDMCIASWWHIFINMGTANSNWNLKYLYISCSSNSTRFNMTWDLNQLWCFDLLRPFATAQFACRFHSQTVISKMLKTRSVGSTCKMKEEMAVVAPEARKKPGSLTFHTGWFIDPYNGLL